MVRSAVETRGFATLRRATSLWSTCLANVEVAQVAQIFGGVNTLSGSVRTESVSAEFSTTASEPWLRLHVTVEECGPTGGGRAEVSCPDFKRAESAESDVLAVRGRACDSWRVRDKSR